RDANAAVAGAARPEAEIAARGVRKARRAGVERAATARGDRHVADDVRRKHRHPRIAGFGFECAAREVERASKLPAERDAHGPQAEIERICRVDLDRRRDHAWVGGRRADVVSGLDGIRDGRPAACKHDRETHQHRLFHREPSAPFGTRPLTRKSSRALSSQRLTSQVPPLPRVTTPSRPLPTDSTFSRSLSVPSTMTPLIALLLAWTLTAALSVKSRMPFSEFSLTRTPAKRPPLPRTLMPSRPLRVATTSSNTVPAIVKRTPSSWLSRSSRCVTRAIASGRAAVSPIPKPATAPRAGAFAPTICAPSVPPYITRMPTPAPLPRISRPSRSSVIVSVSRAARTMRPSTRQRLVATGSVARMRASVVTVSPQAQATRPPGSASPHGFAYAGIAARRNATRTMP